MKKILVFLMTVMMFVACNGCHQSQQESLGATDSTEIVVKDSVIDTIDVDHTIATDRQTMHMN
jgi:hypothetical protein